MPRQQWKSKSSISRTNLTKIQSWEIWLNIFDTEEWYWTFEYPGTSSVIRLPCFYYLTNNSMLTDYWPSKVHVCGFWFLPIEWQFSCKKCGEISVVCSLGNTRAEEEMCSAHVKLQHFLKTPASVPPVFIGLSSVGRQVYYFHNCLCTVRLDYLIINISISFSFHFFLKNYQAERKKSCMDIIWRNTGLA